MRKLFSGRCMSDDCTKLGETVDVWSEGVEAESRTLVNVACEECHGALEHVLTPINIGGRPVKNQACTRDKHIEGCPTPEIISALKQGSVRVEVVVVRNTPVQGVGGMEN